MSVAAFATILCAIENQFLRLKLRSRSLIDLRADLRNIFGGRCMRCCAWHQIGTIRLPPECNGIIMFAQDIMNTDITTISADSSVHQAIDLMVAKNISGLPVIDNDGNLCGLLTEGDLLRRIEFGGGRSAGNSDETSLVDFDDYIRSRSWRVSDVMSASVISVTPDTPAASVAEVMFQHKIKRVPVVSGKRLLGIVSRIDLLKGIVCCTGRENGEVVTMPSLVPFEQDCRATSVSTPMRSRYRFKIPG